MYGVLTDSTEVSREFKDVSQTAVPSALMVRIACPAGQVPVTRFCLLLTAVAVALKFWFTSLAVAGVPGTKVLGIVRSVDQSGEAKTSEPKTKQHTALRRVTLRIASITPS
jgi:hypothetical protein